MIPRIIHQTWKDHDLPDRFRTSRESWQRHHPGWTYRFWTDRDLEEFVKEHYPDILPLFLEYPDQIQRVDAARYMILHHLGGIYSDLDIVCEHPFDHVLEHRAFIPKTGPVGYSNDLMGAEAGSPFFAEVVAGLGRARRIWQHWFVPRHLRVLLTTGSLFLSLVCGSSPHRHDIHVLPGEQYGPGWVQHVEGNTWVGRDYRIFVWIVAHRRSLALAAAVVLAAILAGFAWLGISR